MGSVNAGEIRVEDLVRDYRPGSRGDEWTWADELRDLYAREPARMAWFEDRLRHRDFAAFDKPILLGDDGRVWDGHHRVVAAIAQRLHRLPVTHSEHQRKGN